jgi:S-adenosylmethionine hydrolase
MPRITLLTDFGTADGYLGAIKGVLAAHAPMVRVEDISHEIPPGDVRKGSMALGRYWRRYPPGTVHLAVVDPGVGTHRRALGVLADERFLVAPDNGILTEVLDQAGEWDCVSLVPSAFIPPAESRTFHGRDLFAPAAALLATGTPLEALGEMVVDPYRLAKPPVRAVGEWVVGEVVEVDRFGNLATNLPSNLVESVGEVELAGHWIPLQRTYGEGTPGELLTLVNSDGRVEIAAREGSAANRLGVGRGAGVRVKVPLDHPETDEADPV